MSLLVGAGFSKNVHEAFLSWDELLFDLTEELFCDEINTAYHQQNRSAQKVKLPLTSFTKEKCKEIASRLGYLEIVTEYIRRKGYPEAIATYIEERTPAIEKYGNDFVLKIREDSIKIKADRLSLHRKLIELPWNNIFTTNYDELLDCCVDETQVGQIREEIEDLENETSKLYKERSDLNDAIQALPKDLETPKAGSSGEPIDLVVVNSSLVKDENCKSKSREEIQKTIDLNEEKIRDNDQTIKEKEIALLSRYHIVRSAADLRLKRTKNIIKLHGSLRSSFQKNKFHFKFDGDPHKQYVIAKEDYDDYPKKHEAFTQLMRISLLQESFCLIGFSGVDPNFKAWVNWVKDILHKEAIKNKQHQYKIYLIDVGASESRADQQLFYENHSIIRIPLRSPAVIKFLEQETHNRVKISDPSTALKALLIFLENGDLIHAEISKIDLSFENTRNKIWNNFNVYDFQKKPIYELMRSTLEQLNSIRGKLWIANINYANSHNQHSLITYANHHAYKKYILEEDSDNTLKKLVLLAIRDQYLPIKYFLEEDVIGALLETAETSTDTKTLLARISSFEITENSEQSTYDQLLFLAYSFEFKELKRQLWKWDAQGKEIIQQSGLMSIFDSKTAAERLTLLVEDDYIFTGEELLYLYELLHFLKSSYSWPVDKKIKRAIRNYEKAGFQTLQNKFEYLTEQFEARLKKPALLGQDRYSTTRSISFTKHSKLESALQYLMLMAESGFQLMVHRTHRESVASWYNLFRCGFEYYPYPFLFYSLQYSDDSILRRIGQDYAFSDGNESMVRIQLPKITKRLLKNFDDAPEGYQHHMLVFLSKVIIAVEPEIWQDEFLSVWKKLLAQGLAFEDPRRYSFLNFFISAIQFVVSPTIITTILIDTLVYIKPEKCDHAISYLYYFNRNHFYKRIKSTGIPTELKNLLDETISNLTQNRDDLIFVVGNIHALLSDEQISNVTNALREFDFSKVRNPRSWHIFLYFINNDPNLKQTIKKSLIRNSGIWYTGVTGKTHSFGGMNLIELSRLTVSEQIPNGIFWSQEELEALYERLKEQISGIEYFMSRDDDAQFAFVDVLDEMYWFLRKFKTELSLIPDYDKTNAVITKLFHANRNYEKLEEGLISDDHSTVVWALGELSKVVYQQAAAKAQIIIVMYKVLLQSNPGLEASVGYISAWSKSILRNNEFGEFVQLYVDILNRFKNNPLNEIDVAYIDEKMIVIADQLNGIGHEDDSILWWKNKAEKSDYNNIKQYLINHVAEEGD